MAEELTQEDYAGYLAYKKGVESGKIAAAEAKMSLSDVLHRLVGRSEWRHEGERNAAHAAVTEAYPPAKTEAAAEPPPVTVAA